MIRGDMQIYESKHHYIVAFDSHIYYIIKLNCFRNQTVVHRYQPLTPKAKEILERIKKVNPNSEYILMRKGQQLIGDTFNEHLHKYCHEIGIKGRSSHKIRFTVAPILYSSGVP